VKNGVEFGIEYMRGPPETTGWAAAQNSPFTHRNPHHITYRKPA